MLTSAPNGIYSKVERTQCATVEKGKSDNGYNYKNNLCATASSEAKQTTKEQEKR
jgi:hypothetical protein